MAKNPKVRKAAKSQLITYCDSFDIKYGIYMVVIYYEKEYSYLDEIKSTIKEINDGGEYKFHLCIVDAIDKPSASNL